MKPKIAIFALVDAEGYAAGDVQPVNLFPRTAHCECAVALTRNSNTSQKLK
jgi:hypothetical protein